MELYIGRNGKDVKEWSKARRCNNCHDNSGMFDEWNFCPVCGVKALYEAPERAEGYYKPIPYTVEKEGMFSGSKWKEKHYICGNCNENILSKTEWKVCCHCGGHIDWEEQEVEEVEAWNYFSEVERQMKEWEVAQIRRSWREKRGY